MREALNLAGRNVEGMQGIYMCDERDSREHWVVWGGNPLEIGGRVRREGWSK